MNNHDEFSELRDDLRRRAEGTRPTSDLVGGALTRARRIRRRRTVIAAVTAVVVVGGGIAGGSAVIGQWPNGDVPVAGVTATPSAGTGAPTSVASTSATSTSNPPSSASAPPSSDAPSSDAPSSEPPSGRSSSEDTSPAPPPPPETSTQGPSASNSPGTKQQTPLCTADDTTIAVAAGQGAAGHVEYVITMTNTSDRTCTVEGYPGVSIVAGDDGTQVGAPADRDRDHGPAEPVTVRPGGTATASVWVAQADNHGDECKPVDARGFRIYLPEERSAHFAKVDVRGCQDPDIHLMKVRPFVAG